MLKIILEKLYKRIYKGVYYKNILIACCSTKHDAFKCLDKLLTSLNIPFTVYGETVYINYKRAYIVVDFILYGDPYENRYDLYLDEEDILDIVSSNNKKKAFEIIFNRNEYGKWQKYSKLT